MKSLNLNSKWIFLIIAAVLGLSLISYLRLPNVLSKKSEIINETVTRLLLENGVKNSHLKKELYSKGRIRVGSFKKISKEYRVPSRFDLGAFRKKLDEATDGIKCELTESQIDLDKTVSVFSASIEFKKKELFSLRLIQKAQVKKVYYKDPPLLKPHVPAYCAIVIDDWGYNTRNVDTLLSIDKPLTLAILPNLPYSKKIAKKANKKNLEIILHLPLEPHRQNIRYETDTILTSMDEKEIIDSLDSSLRGFSNIKGVSNHQGSKATEDRRLMGVIFGELKKRNLFFLDSLVTSKSVCEPLARETKVKFAKRSMFLDNEADYEYIKAQLEHLVYLAKRDGEAIGICHDKDITLRVLKETLDEFEQDGVEFVKLSQLVK